MPADPASDVLAVIPARGGSKGIPRKNLAPLCGRPLLGWTIEAARNAIRVGRVVVSTDDSEIGAVAQRFGADVVWRPRAISGDDASSEEALLHTLEHLQAEEGYVPRLLAFLQCTSPLTTAADVDGTLAALSEESADTAVAVVPFHYFLWRRNGAEGGVGINHDRTVRLLRQQREPEYLEAGAVYTMRVDGFREHGSRFFGRTALFVMPAEHRWEIDEPVDLRVAEMLLRDRLDGERARRLPDPLDALILDFDGVLTDNRVLVTEDGREAVVCHRGDGMGLDLLRRSGLRVLVISTERNPVVAARCRKLNVSVLQDVADKWPRLRSWLSEHRLDANRVAYVGNDVNDVECMRNVGCGVAVADAAEPARAVADVLLTRGGGDGAVRELCDLLLRRSASSEGT